MDFNDFYVFTNTTKVSHDTRSISMFSGSKPDLMMFRKNNPGTGVVCQYKEEEDMETEETEQNEYIALSGATSENKIDPVNNRPLA